MTSPFATISRKYLGVICLFVITVILIAGLWPFDFNPVNKVEWLQNRNGIRFYGQGMVVSRQHLNFGTNHLGTNSVSIEIWVLPHKESNHTVASIVTLYDHDREVFMAGQWKSELIIRVPTIKTEQQIPYREIGVPNALVKGVIQLITMVSEKETTHIYIDGRLAERSPNFSLIPFGKGLSGHLILGNSPDGTHPWNGSFFGLAVYDRALCNEEVSENYLAWRQNGSLRSKDAFKQVCRGQFSGPIMPSASYLFNESNGELVHDYSGMGHDLMIPPVFQPMHRTVLGMPDKSIFFSHSNMKDIVINIVGFIPFGFFLAAWLRFQKSSPATRAYIFSILIGALISLAIELSQVYLPTRDSSLMDVLSNILGTAIGASLLGYAFHMFH